MPDNDQQPRPSAAVSRRARRSKGLASPAVSEAVPPKAAKASGKTSSGRRGNAGSRRKPAAAADLTVQAPSTLTLPAHCTIHEASSLRSLLLPLLAAAETVRVDTEALEQIDAAGIQVLAAFLRSLRREGAGVIWQSQSPVLADAVKRLGAEACFELDDARG